MTEITPTVYKPDKMVAVWSEDVLESSCDWTAVTDISRARDSFHFSTRWQQMELWCNRNNEHLTNLIPYGPPQLNCSNTVLQVPPPCHSRIDFRSVQGIFLPVFLMCWSAAVFTVPSSSMCSDEQPPTCFPWCPCKARTTWAASPHVAPLTVPALVALIRRGVPGRSLWRHRLTALLALLQPGPACTPASPLIPPKGPGACGEVGHWRWSWITAWLGSVHLCCWNAIHLRNFTRAAVKPSGLSSKQPSQRDEMLAVNVMSQAEYHIDISTCLIWNSHFILMNSLSYGEVEGWRWRLETSFSHVCGNKTTVWRFCSPNTDQVDFVPKPNQTLNIVLSQLKKIDFYHLELDLLFFFFFLCCCCCISSITCNYKASLF